jgi:hypothetical protein
VDWQVGNNFLFFFNICTTPVTLCNENIYIYIFQVVCNKKINKYINLVEPYMIGLFGNKLSKRGLSNKGMASKDSPKSARAPPKTSFLLYSQYISFNRALDRHIVQIKEKKDCHNFLNPNHVEKCCSELGITLKHHGDVLLVPHTPSPLHSGSLL